MSHKPARNGAARPAPPRPPQPERANGETLWKKLNGYFTRMAKWSAWTSGRPMAFILAVAVVLVWLTTGPMFDFSDTWQLVINTGTTIVTFLMVFLIQNSQNRDAAAIQLKLDELIRANQNARNR